MKMTTLAESFYEQITDAIRRPNRLFPVYAFRFHLEEIHSMTESGNVKKTIDGTLTLLWQDETVSLHKIKSPLLYQNDLPVEMWQKGRFRDDSYRLFVKAKDTPVAPLAHYDDKLAEAIEQGTMPDIPDNFRAHLVVRKRTVAHSKGLFLEDQETEIVLRSLNCTFPFDYVGRKLPSEHVRSYVQTEASWYKHFSILPSERLTTSEASMYLFSPEAFRRLLHSGLGVHLTRYAGLGLAHDFLRHCMEQTTLSVEHNPRVPWSLGSRLFTEEGNYTSRTPILIPHRHSVPALLSSNEAFTHNQKPNPGYNRRALHWHHAEKYRFRDWVQNQPEVVYIPTLHIPETFSPFAQEVAWVPQAVLFTYGRPTLSGPVHIPFSLRAILTCPRMETVEKVGWDGLGLALQTTFMVNNS